MFSERLKELREEAGLSQKEIADILNISRTSISGYESTNREPDFSTLIKIANFFDISLDYLLGRTDVKVPFEFNNAKHKDYIKILNMLSSDSDLSKLIIDLVSACENYANKKIE